MSQSQGNFETDEDGLTNGPGAAAILSAGIGCAMVGILAFAGDASAAIGRILNFYNPTGTLSGVTIVAIIAWLVSWFILNRRWQTQVVDLTKVNVAAFALLLVGFLLTFPPFMDLLQGK
jgi:drug/metabolite transporter (DMT)-like permease